MKKNEALNLLISSLAIFLAIAIFGVLIEKYFGYDEYEPVEFRM